MKINKLINEIADKILSLYKDKEQANIHAWWILQWLTGKEQGQLISQKDIILVENQKKLLEDIIDQHLNKHKPIQYIFGVVPFLDLNIEVQPPILIPRPETEDWVSNLIDVLKVLDNRNFKILDLCTGTGCIGLAFAKAFKESSVIAADISENACLLASKNAEVNKINNIKIIKSDLFSNIAKDIYFDLIISNPPYVSYEEWLNLDPMVKNWEDFSALVAKDQGLSIIKEIIDQSPCWINYRSDFYKKNIPQFAVEIGYKQGSTVKELLNKSGFVNIEIKKDLGLNDRLATAGVADEICAKQK